MPKKRIASIAKEYNISVDELQSMITFHLAEGMVSGRGKNLWIDEGGQTIIENLTPMPVMARGLALRRCPNKSFLYVKHFKTNEKIGVRIPRNMNNYKFDGKVVYFKEVREGETIKYTLIKNSCTVC